MRRQESRWWCAYVTTVLLGFQQLPRLWISLPSLLYRSNPVISTDHPHRWAQAILLQALLTL